jgi:hypothetical protein
VKLIHNRQAERIEMKKYLLCIMLFGRTAIAASNNDFGSWTFVDDKTPKGTPVCALATSGKSNAIIRNIVIKALGGNEFLSVTLFKDAWKVPQGTTVPITLSFKDNQPIALSAYGDGNILDIQLPTESTAIFLSLLASKSTLQISYPRGKEAAWEINLASIKPVLKSFVECAQSLSSQPF